MVNTKNNNNGGILQEFLRLESAGGILLMAAAALALVLANTPLEKFYAWFLELPLQIRIGAIDIAKPLLLWINDGLMAVFFLMIGLEMPAVGLNLADTLVREGGCPFIV